MPPADKGIDVEIVYALPARQILIKLGMPHGATVRDAIVVSGLLLTCPEINLMSSKVGIFGRRVTTDTILQSGDRVEIYRALMADPKEARRLRARKPR
jgi:putative ubiquitin-RnfH superfamily antitoxin RatB of RatAB toxin-antitoxin module